jgi:peptidase E
MGRILAIGGGGFAMGEHASPIDAYLRKLIQTDKPRICLLATPVGDHPPLVADFHRVYGELGFETSYLACFYPGGENAVDPRECKTHLLEQDAIFVSGGNANSAMALWRQFGIDAILKQAWEKGVLLAGMSAGAICWFEHHVPPPDDHDTPPDDYLGLLHDTCEVHYRGEDRKAGVIETMNRHGLASVTAIADYAAVLYDGSAINEVLSWKAGSTAYRFERVGEEIVAHALSVNVIGSVASPRERQSVSLDPVLLGAYVGQYTLAIPRLMTVTLEEGRLFTQLSGQQKIEIYPENERDFFLKVVDAQLSFEKDSNGKVTALTLHQNGRDIPGVKIVSDPTR